MSKSLAKSPLKRTGPIQEPPQKQRRIDQFFLQMPNNNRGSNIGVGHKRAAATELSTPPNKRPKTTNALGSPLSKENLRELTIKAKSVPKNKSNASPLTLNYSKGAVKSIDKIDRLTKATPLPASSPPKHHIVDKATPALAPTRPPLASSPNKPVIPTSPDAKPASVLTASSPQVPIAPFTPPNRDIKSASVLASGLFDDDLDKLKSRQTTINTYSKIRRESSQKGYKMEMMMKELNKIKKAHKTKQSKKEKEEEEEGGSVVRNEEEGVDEWNYEEEPYEEKEEDINKLKEKVSYDKQKTTRPVQKKNDKIVGKYNIITNDRTTVKPARKSPVTTSSTKNQSKQTVSQEATRTSLQKGSKGEGSKNEVSPNQRVVPQEDVEVTQEFLDDLYD